MISTMTLYVNRVREAGQNKGSITHTRPHQRLFLATKSINPYMPGEGPGSFSDLFSNPFDVVKSAGRDWNVQIWKHFEGAAHHHETTSTYRAQILARHPHTPSRRRHALLQPRTNFAPFPGTRRWWRLVSISRHSSPLFPSCLATATPAPVQLKSQGSLERSHPCHPFTKLRINKLYVRPQYGSERAQD